MQVSILSSHHQTNNKQKNMETVTIKNVIYTILAEVALTGKAAERTSNYVSLVSLRKPKGTKEFLGMRRKDNSEIEILSV